MKIDLKLEQEASLKRPRYKYSLMAKIFFLTMDILTGKKTTIAKAKLIETLASIPYRTWELIQYFKLTSNYKKTNMVSELKSLVKWSRAAQDNEYWHLIVLHEKMREDNIKDPWYLFNPLPYMMVLSYVLLTKMMAFFSPKRAYLFNAEFEDHAEHVYAEFINDHPELDEQPLTNLLVKEYADVKTWGDIIRRIGLDEREHMNKCFELCGKKEMVVPYVSS